MSDGQDFHLNSDHRTRLLKIGLSASSSEDHDVEPNEKRTDTLYQILTSPLFLETDAKTSLPDFITGQVQDLVSISGKPMGELIQDLQTDLLTLRKIKEHSKLDGTNADSKEAQDAFMAVYFAAIASALVFHDTTISHHKDEDLSRFFDSFCKKPWVLTELRTLFQKASSLVNDSSSEADDSEHSVD